MYLEKSLLEIDCVARLRPAALRKSASTTMDTSSEIFIFLGLSMPAPTLATITSRAAHCLRASVWQSWCSLRLRCSR